MSYPQLTPAGQALVGQLAQNHGLSQDAVTHMLMAVAAGGGTLAQFNHPEFGGMGQWMAGGMTMTSDLFNHALKARVDSICQALSQAWRGAVSTPGVSQSQSQGGAMAPLSDSPFFVPDPASAPWWPKDLGTPQAVGSQNGLRYAYFGGARRLAVDSGGDVWVYDTLDHQIGGFGQQQGGGTSISLSSQYGTINLSALPVVSRNGQFVPPPAPLAPMPAPMAAPPAFQGMGASAPAPAGSDGVLATIERLGALKERGLITEDEYQTKKMDLLSRL